MTTQEKIQKLEEQVKMIEKQSENITEFSKLIDDTEKDNYSVITDVVTQNLDPKDDVNQKVNVAQRAVRKVGNRFLNLFKITFTVEFAGTMLIHWTIPRIDENGNPINR